MPNFADTFNENAEGYGKYRPGFPGIIRDRLVDLIERHYQGKVEKTLTTLTSIYKKD